MTIYNTSTDCLNFYRAGGWYDPCVTLTALSGRTAINTLIGGSGNEDTWGVQQTSDGGYVIASTSGSCASGNVSSTTHGGNDFLIVKLDFSGNIIWNRLLGGSDYDDGRSIQPLQLKEPYSKASGCITSMAALQTYMPSTIHTGIP